MRVAALLLASSLCAATAAAQTPEGRVELGGGVRFVGTESLASVPSEQTRVGGTTRDVFRTETDVEPFPALDMRIGVGLTPVFQVEGSVVIGTTDVTTSVTGDVEGVADTSASVPLTHYGIEGNLVVRLTAWRPGRLTPLIVAGAGYFRQVQDGGVLVDSGRSYHLGAGGDYRWRSAPRARIRAAGLRVDARVVVQQDGLADDVTRTLPAVSASVYIRF